MAQAAQGTASENWTLEIPSCRFKFRGNLHNFVYKAYMLIWNLQILCTVVIAWFWSSHFTKIISIEVLFERYSRLPQSSDLCNGSKSAKFPYIHCNLNLVCPPNQPSETVKRSVACRWKHTLLGCDPSILILSSRFFDWYLKTSSKLLSNWWWTFGRIYFEILWIRGRLLIYTKRDECCRIVCTSSSEWNKIAYFDTIDLDQLAFALYFCWLERQGIRVIKQIFNWAMFP